jgi:predicted protein tyrosine phosphatase
MGASSPLDFHIVGLTVARSLAQAPQAHNYAGVVQLLSPQKEGALPDFPCPSLRLECSDRNLIEADEPDAPSREQVQQLLDFARGLPQDGPMLFHCLAGKSRSPAAALIVFTDRLGPRSEALAARILKERYPSSEPNLVMLQHADEIMGRNGAIFAAGRAIAVRRQEREVYESGWL